MLRMVSAQLTSSNNKDKYFWPTSVPTDEREILFDTQSKFPKETLGELPAQATLRTLALADVHSSPTKERHPFAVYNISISRVLRKLRIALAEAERLNSTLVSMDLNTRSAFIAQEAFLDIFEDLIYAFAEHHEDTRKIYGLLHGPSKKDRSKAIRMFSRLTSSLADPYLTIVNNIKHGHQRLQPVAGYILKGSVKQLIFGYYVASFDRPSEGPPNDDRGCIQPDTIIHPESTANSIPRDLKIIAASIVQFSHEIARRAEQVNRTIAVEHGLTPCEFIPKEIISRLNSLPTSLFPNELGSPHVVFGTKDEETDVVFESKVYSHPFEEAASRLEEITVLFRSDGVSDIFKLPYYGKDKWEGELQVTEFPGG